MAGIRALLGLFPKTGEYESQRIKLEEEYFELLAFKNSKELRDFHKLEAQISSDEFLQKKKEILSLRYSQTDDFQKEKQFTRLSRKSDIKLYYKTKNSDELKRFQEFEKSKDLKTYHELEEYLDSTEYAEIKKEASLPARQKFAKSDLARTLQQHIQLKRSAKIVGYYRFIKHKAYDHYLRVIEERIPEKVEDLDKTVNSSEFRQKLASMNRAERKVSSEQQKINELKNIRKSGEYRDYLKLAGSTNLNYYKELHNSEELELFEDLDKFINSDEFKRQRKEIETRSFKDTDAYGRLEQFKTLKGSEPIRFYFKFKASKELKNYNSLLNSERISSFEELEAYVQSDEFKKFKAYCLMAPKKRWFESQEYEILRDYELKKKSEKITWYFKNIDHKRFNWHRIWTETFHDDFSDVKLDNRRWLTRYYWGEKNFKESYSLSQDKHFVTNGQNLNIENNRLHIITRKEQVKGASWHPEYGFITREFGYTSGLINTANSLRQKYGTFEAKIRIHENKDLLNAFWMVGTKILPHINIMKAGKKLVLGNHWGDPTNLESIKRTGQKYTSSRSRKKFTIDYFIYTLEWLPGKLTWKINGIEVASTTRGVPQESMYLVISSGLQKHVDGILPADMEIDWVRCFQKNELLGTE